MTHLLTPPQWLWLYVILAAWLGVAALSWWWLLSTEEPHARHLDYWVFTFAVSLLWPFLAVLCALDTVMGIVDRLSGGR